MKLLDLYCGAGGAAKGYYNAGFTDIVGVDIEPQPNYPFKFIQSDAIEFLKNYGDTFDVIHASPPCQAYSWASPGDRRKYPQLIGPTQDLLWQLNKIYVIENVYGAPLYCPIVLCGKMFGLEVIRHRRFECNIKLKVPRHKPHTGNEWTVAGHMNGTLKEWSKAMGINWMKKKKELAQAIPPIYTEYIGKQIICKISRSY